MIVSIAVIVLSTSLCGPCVEDRRTGTILEVAEAHCVDVWDATLCVSKLAWFSVEVKLFVVASTGLCFLSSCKQVG